ncbi:MAG: hypothetical protein Q8930_00490 [Bacillota bacterium]|nr:hypothetical protein [Bacillota bacterium]
MPQNNTLAPHEMLELRELLSNEVLGMKKLQVSMSIVKDEELKAYMQKSMDTKKNNICSIQDFIASNPM